MPAINFMRRFRDDVASGRKTQTIRRVRKVPIKVGDRLQLYTGMRTKHTELIGVADCFDVVPIVITDDGAVIGDVSIESLRSFAKRDGFGSWEQLAAWFKFTHGLPFEGVVIHWRNLVRPEGAVSCK